MRTTRAAASGLFALLVALPALAGARNPTVKCKMDFHLKGWSLIYQTAHGSGIITCDNGQKADVTIETEGGGLTVGKEDVTHGTGTFSAVSNIKELYGSYAAAGAEAGAVKSSKAMAMTKGEVSLALAGTGRGFDLGVAVSKFTIEPARSKAR